MKALKMLLHRTTCHVLCLLLLAKVAAQGQDRTSITADHDEGQGEVDTPDIAKDGSSTVANRQNLNDSVAASHDVDCDPTWDGIPPEASYQIVFTTRAALSEMGVQVHRGNVEPVFKNRVRIPSVSDMLDETAIKRHEDQLMAGGFVLQTAEHVVLLKPEGKFLECNYCAGDATYQVVQLLSVGEDDDGIVFHFVSLTYPTWKFGSFLLSIPGSALAFHGNKKPAINDVGLLACIGRGYQPVFFPKPLETGSQAPVFRTGPFQEKVDVVNVRAFRGSQQNTSLLEVTLSLRESTHAVAHVMKEGTTVVYYASVFGPPVVQSALVLGSFTAKRKWWLQRNTRTGPVLLKCSAWESLIKKTIRRLSGQGQLITKRRSRKPWIIAGLLGATTLLSVGSIVKGYRRDSQRGVNVWNYGVGLLPDRVRASFRIGEISSLSASVNPYNLVTAAGVASADTILDSRVIRAAVNTSGLRGAANAVLLKGGGLYGAGASVAAAVLLIKYHAIRGAWRAVKKRLAQQELNDIVGDVIGAAKGDEISTRLRRGTLFVVLDEA
ncbi:conserved hypothetical protein [Neospora caninum Liverpool]|uniref:Transmembrane protein n=1 Tax=Neospora caninum (strain Liverpool) TaxID=572307 RepID=F0VPH9_NEOCL|nr:conserved hypothetical protein [Neospora caninum Liverpool]CBZ55625.1 conserved hypothetical protein [Neospora caninum Liverpool]CEL70367.1 TPA: hypothetical protein BN1204_060500 [Neospora caninum Liverpool]|eukprot:XP_003885653.1 conserved hypothetical protein [Neospora caninum Liverpool]